MNELYGDNNAKPRSKRRWIYLLAALIILCVLMAMPGAATAQLEMVIDKDNPIEVVLTPPKDCRLERVFFKANNHVPRSGKLVTLVVNGMKIPAADWDKLDTVDVAADEGCENRNAPIDWNKFKGVKTLTVAFEDVNKNLQRYDLSLIFQLVGNPDKIKNWHSFVTISRKDAPLLIKKAVPEIEKSKK